MGLRGRTNLREERFYFVTTTVVGFLKIFSEDIYKEIIIDVIKYYKKKYEFEILGYVIMPNHFHWIVEVEPEKGTISEIMRDIKKSIAWKTFDELELREEKEVLAKLEEAANGIKDQKRKLWMKRFDDEVIRNEKMFWTKLKYIHNNPVKAGIVENVIEYNYSSAGNYAGKSNPKLEVNTEYAGIEIIN